MLNVYEEVTHNQIKRKYLFSNITAINKRTINLIYHSLMSLRDLLLINTFDNCHNKPLFIMHIHMISVQLQLALATF